MPTFNQSILTNAGKALMGRVNGGQEKIVYSKIAFSSMDNSKLSDDEVRSLTDITPAEITVKPETFQSLNSAETNVRGYGTNDNLKTGLYVSTYGVYVTDSTGKEILFAVELSDHPDYLIPNDDKKHPSGILYTFKINISETDNITFTSDTDVNVTLDDLKELNKDINDRFSKLGTGVNLLPDSARCLTWSNQGGNVELEFLENDLCRIHIYDLYAYYQVDNPIPLVNGQTYTFSCELKGQNEGKTDVHYFDSYIENEPLLTDYVTTEWKKFSVTFICNGKGITQYGPRRGVEVGGDWNNILSTLPGGSIYVRKQKLEIGSVATEWTPSPQDNQGLSNKHWQTVDTFFDNGNGKLQWIILDGILYLKGSVVLNKGDSMSWGSNKLKTSIPSTNAHKAWWQTYYTEHSGNHGLAMEFENGQLKINWGDYVPDGDSGWLNIYQSIGPII